MCGPGILYELFLQVTANAWIWQIGELISERYLPVNVHLYSNIMDYIAHNWDISQYAISDDGKGVLLETGC